MSAEILGYAIGGAALTAIIGNVLLWLKYEKAKDYAARSKTIDPPPKAGEWVRFLVAQPELEVEIGDRAQIRVVVPGDDWTYVLRIDTRSGRTFYTTFSEQEAWQFECIR